MPAERSCRIALGPPGERFFRDQTVPSRIIRYQTIDALNLAWGNVFWSMEYPSFEAVGLPVRTPTDANPAHHLDFRRFRRRTGLSRRPVLWIDDHR